MAKRTKAPRARRSCGTMAAHMSLLERFPAFRQRQFDLELATTARRESTARVARAPRLVTVDVVVNVVYQTSPQNVSDSQIKSQIAVLNRDFAATNPDREKVPAPWQGLVTDSRLRFRLAKVVRKKTTRSSFSTDDGVKRASGGGVAPFEPKTHLNLWVCALADGVLGYAQFPGGPTATDGVVIDTHAFGTKGTAQAPFNLGRTATHEVGHYFNLRHIWGDTEDCSGSDFVADTPNAAGPNFGAPAFPSVSCSNGPNGDMFMNYMDYVDDAAMFLFTAQQVVRIRTALEESRPGLL
ncbi:MAG TPA: zinc metalloprotease [Vicinamibacteria bacterium]|nr:zinc metalloprotease [Vicinamibacteria bacterium]